MAPKNPLKLFFFVSVELRIILIGDKDVGKKSIINRIKLINSTETKKNNFKGFMAPKKKIKAK